MTDGEQCPRCGQAPVVHGPRSGEGLVVHGTLSTQAARFVFRPEELRLFSLSFQFPGVPVPAAAAACASCGLVWAELDAAALRQKLKDLGNEDVRQRLGLLDGE
jgi:hypothetical protein